jgi:glycosyltransferase involved in cell wall biosynthesis
VVIPVFNRSERILEAVDSALAQSYPAIEVIVVDDGSTDGSGQVVEQRAERDERIRVVSQENRGPSAARNAGMAATDSRFITFLDSDDLFLPEGILLMMNHLATNRETDGVIAWERTEVAAGIEPPPVAKALMRREGPSFAAVSVLLPKRLAEEVGGFDESLRHAEDLDLLIRLRHAGITIGHLEETVIVRRYFGDNLTYDTSATHLLAVLRKQVEATRG